MEKISEQIQYFTIEDIKSRMEEHEDQVDILFQNPRYGLEQEVDKKTIEFIESLLKEKERFDKVYRTTGGSYYFILPNGQSLRFKYIKEKNGVDKYEVQKIMEETVFISPDQYSVIKNSGFYNGFKEVGYDIGNIPFEVSSGKGEKVFDKDGLGGVSVDAQTLKKYHFGHPVSEIVK